MVIIIIMLSVLAFLYSFHHHLLRRLLVVHRHLPFSFSSSSSSLSFSLFFFFFLTFFLFYLFIIYFKDNLGVGYDAVHLEPVANQAFVGQQALFVSIGERGYSAHVKVVKRPPIVLPLAKHGDPAQARLQSPG